MHKNEVKIAFEKPLNNETFSIITHAGIVSSESSCTLSIFQYSKQILLAIWTRAYLKNLSLCNGFFVIFFCVMLMLCIIKNNQLADLKSKENDVKIQNNEIRKLSRKISLSDIKCSKSLDRIFSKNKSLKKAIGEISKKSFVKNVLFKSKKTKDIFCDVENIEIRFCAKKEYQIYRFIQNIHSKLSGVIIFDTIQIIKKAKNQFITKVTFKMFSFFKKNKKSLYIKEKETIDISKNIHLFAEDDIIKYTLFCVMDNSKAYINNFWANVGDEIGQYKIIDIGQNSIKIKTSKKTFVVPIGSTW